MGLNITCSHINWDDHRHGYDKDFASLVCDNWDKLDTETFGEYEDPSEDKDFIIKNTELLACLINGTNWEDKERYFELINHMKDGHTICFCW